MSAADLEAFIFFNAKELYGLGHPFYLTFNVSGYTDGWILVYLTVVSGSPMDLESENKDIIIIIIII